MTPKPLNEFGSEMGWYLVLMGVPHLLVVVVLCGIALALKLIWHVGIGRLWLPILIFSAGFWFLSGIAHAIWSCFVWGNLYWTPDYLIGFTPFKIFTSKDLDIPFGSQKAQLLNGTLFQIQVVWFVLFASVSVASACIAAMCFKFLRQAE